MGIDAKISITTACGARCATCPSWQREPKVMGLDDFETVFKKLCDAPIVSRILINGTGDITAIDGWHDYFDIMAKHKNKPLIMTTNGAYLDMVPDCLDELIISFNGGTPETYKESTGLDFNEVAAKIRALYPQFWKLKNLEMHCLIWKENENTEEEFVEYWRDFPGALRVSWKCDNQGGDYFGTMRGMDGIRIPCSYLSSLNIEHDGRVSACCHDWEGKTDFGNLLNDSVGEVWRSPEREKMVAQHYQGKYSGICEHCNFNVRAEGKFAYI